MTVSEKPQWRDAWEKMSFEAWSKTCKAFPPDDEQREAFQLLAAAFIYHLNALKELSDERLHVLAAGARHDIPWKSDEFTQLFTASRWPHFCGKMKGEGEREYFGTMHLASASFRLSTALCLIAKSASSKFNQLFDFDKDDWNRGRLQNYLTAAAELDCSANPKDLDVGSLSDDALAIRLTMVVAHRDEFGHGEEGKSSKGWRVQRSESFRKFFRCRLAEAQLNLLLVGLSDLEKFAPLSPKR